MKAKDYTQEHTITAMAMVLSKSALLDNAICLKVFLGQKSSLITDNNKFSLTEIIPIDAAGELATKVAKSINTNDQIKFTAKITHSKSHHLKLLGIEKQENG